MCTPEERKRGAGVSKRALTAVIVIACVLALALISRAISEKRTREVYEVVDAIRLEYTEGTLPAEVSGAGLRLSIDAERARYPDTEVFYELTHKHSGSLADRESWLRLGVSVWYGGRSVGVKSDYAYLTVYFGKHLPQYVEELSRGGEALEAGGVTVRRAETPGEVFKHRDRAFFEYGGCAYYLQTFSRENAGLFDDTLKCLLG